MELREEVLDLKKALLNDKYLFDDPKIQIGKGGSGIVYLINQLFDEEHEIQLKRAIKFYIYRDDLINGNGLISKQDFSKEIKNLTQLNHQNIVKVIDGGFLNREFSGTNYSVPYMITEYVDGKDLKKIIENNEIKNYFMDIEDVFGVIEEIIEAVEYLHSCNFFHCDIAPKNIFLKKDKDNHIHAILGDLGTGYTKEKENKYEDAIKVIGTYNYMPKIVKEKNNTMISYKNYISLQPEWDIYSLKLSCKELVESILNNEILLDESWYLKRLISILSNNKYKKVTEIRKQIEMLRPGRNNINNIQELSNINHDIRTVLIPCGNALITQRIEKILKHDKVFRLNNVPQLLEGSATYPGANHTRYEHSIGTYERMRKALIAMFKNPSYITNMTEEQVIIALLAALLSSLDAFPYSYAIQEIQYCENDFASKLSRRNVFKKIITGGEDNSLENFIRKIFPKYNIKANEIAYAIFGQDNYTEKNKELEKIYYLLNSSIGIRTIDYIVRDAHHIGVEMNIDSNGLYYNLAINKGEICLNQRGISVAEQILTFRSWMFKRIYWSDPNRAHAALLKYLFYISFKNQSQIVDEIENRIISCTKEDILDIINSKCNNDIKKEVSNIISFVRQNGKKRFQSILVLDTNARYENASQNCNRFYSYSYSRQNQVRIALEKKIMSEYNILDNFLKERGVLVLIDIPYERMDNKLGRDIRIIRHDGNIMTFDKASGITRGLQENYENQLKILRVFAHPDLYELLIKKEKTRNELFDKINKLLCDFL